LFDESGERRCLVGRKSGFKIPGVSFSWKRAVGITAAKQKIARATGIPLTRAGRQRKVGRALGCLFPTVAIAALLFALPVHALWR
jgi:hypothetical protein